MTSSSLSRRSLLSMAALGTLSFVCLSACNDKNEQGAPEQAPAEQATETAPAAPEPQQTVANFEEAHKDTPPPADSLTVAREALFNEAVYELARKATDPAIFPELNEEVKVLLEHMETYYAELAKGPEGTMERTRLALQIASTLRDLNSNRALDAYTRAQQELQTLPEGIRKSDDGQRCAGDIENGIGSCLLAQRKTTEAMAHYEAALAIAQAQFDTVAPAEGTKPQQGEVDPDLSRKATDLLDNLRCLGDCQRLADDPEEARATYLQGQALVERLNVLSSSMSISYVKLLTALGNLDNAAGRSKEALSSWVTAANICKQLNNSSPRLDVKAETKRCYDALIPPIQTVAAALQKAEAEKPADNQPADIQTEPISPALKDAAAPAAEAPKPESPKALPPAAPKKDDRKPAKPANKRKRK